MQVGTKLCRKVDLQEEGSVSSALKGPYYTFYLYFTFFTFYVCVTLVWFYVSKTATRHCYVATFQPRLIT